jgi:hypothetical protein
MMKMPTAMPVMARAGLSQRVHAGVAGVLEVVEAVSVITAYLSCGVTRIIRQRRVSLIGKAVATEDQDWDF